jgi:hypothetical protein
MTAEEFDTFRRSIEDTFISLYVIDVGSLSLEEKKTHQELLAAAYLAVVRIENKAFNELTKVAIDKLAMLSERTQLLQQKLAGFKKAAETLQIVSGALDVLTAIAKLFK